MPWSQIDPEKRKLLAYPSGYCRAVLKMPLYDKQAEIMDSMGPLGARTTVATCNESGKTSKIICGLILWHGALFPRGTAISTSGSWLQVTNQLVPNLKRFEALHPRWRFHDTEILKDADHPVWAGFSTNDPGRAEGFHGSVEEPLLAMADEAKSVADDILRAMEDRCNPQRMAMLSSPGYAEGDFYLSHTLHAHLWKRFKMTVRDCPHISEASVQRRIAKWGADHPLLKSALWAEFMDFAQDAMLSLVDWERCLESPPPRSGTARRAFCDFAGQGENENVCAVRVGNEVWIQDAWSGRSEMESVGRFVLMFNNLRRQIGLQPHEIEGDADGIGGPMMARLAEVGWPIVPFHGGAEAREPQFYENRISEVWWKGCDAIRACAIRIRENDEDLRAQLLSRKKWMGSSGRLMVQPKKELLKKFPSPDKADAVLGAIADMPTAPKIEAIRTGDPLTVFDDNVAGVDPAILAGMDAGG